MEKGEQDAFFASSRFADEIVPRTDDAPDEWCSELYRLHVLTIEPTSMYRRRGLLIAMETMGRGSVGPRE